MKLSIFGEYGGVGITRSHLQNKLNEIKRLRRMCRMKLSAIEECAERN
jgi:hypothetical protein